MCKDDDWIVSVEHEIKMHRLCGNHPNILPLLASAVVNAGRGVREYYLLLPLCSGGSIQDAIDAASPGTSAFTVKDCLEIFAELAGGVQAMHDIGFCHRDVKPSNIMFLPNGRPQLMDLGSCALVNMDIQNMKEAAMLADTAAEKSTPTYRAPELFDCAHLIPHCVGPETDVWSLGCVLYAMAFGRSPFEFGPHGSFERLAVMNASVHFAGHTPGGLEHQLWATGTGGNQAAPAAQQTNQMVVETPGFVQLVRAMLDPNPHTRIHLKDAVHRALWKVGVTGEDDFNVDGGGGGSEGEDGGVSSKEASARSGRDSWSAVVLGEVVGPEGAGGKACGAHEEEAVDMTDFVVHWDTAVVDTAPKKLKKKKKKKKKKKRSYKKKNNTEVVVESDGENSGEASGGREEGGKEENLEDSLISNEQQLSIDEDEDEFGDFAASPNPKQEAGGE